MDTPVLQEYTILPHTASGKRLLSQKGGENGLARDAAWASAGMAANMKMCATMMVK
jgi:hypothetical protein